jgi:hypothetical protein
MTEVKGNYSGYITLAYKAAMPEILPVSEWFGCLIVIFGGKEP